MRCAVCGDRVYDVRGGTPTPGNALHVNAMRYLRHGIDQHHAVPVEDTVVEPEKVSKWV